MSTQLQQEAREVGASRVTVVDDDPDVLVGIMDTLELRGYRVRTYPAGNAALDDIREEAPDVVLSDVRMPGMDGFALLREIKRTSPKTPVVLLSAYGDWEAWNRAMKDGAVDLLAKPVSNEFIAEYIDKVLKRRDSAEEQPKET